MLTVIIKLGGTNALLAPLENLGIKEDGLVAVLNNFSKKGSQKEKIPKDGPSGKLRAPWRSEEEFFNLLQKDLCVGCKQSGY